MRIIARNTLITFWTRHPETKPALEHWFKIAKSADWASTQAVQESFPKAKVLNRERVRFEIHGGDYRLIVAFRFEQRLAFIKFIGTHAEYDRIDALSVSRF